MILSIGAVLAHLCAPAAARAQLTGQVSGSIYDQTAAPLSGVQVVIRGVTDRRAETRAAGQFAFQDLPTGDYEISAELSGFERARRALRVQAGDPVTVSFTLHVAIVEQTIVTAAKAGERDVQTIPMAISAVSSADIGRLGTQTVSETPALAPSVTFSQNSCGLRPRPSPVDYRRVHPKPHEHGLHHGDLRDGTHGVWRTSWTLASVRR